MHELVIADSIVATALAEARKHGAERVTRIRCRIGRLRQVERQFLCDAFEIARQGSAASTAVLEVEYSGTRLACRECGRTVELDDWRFDCPHCRSSNVQLSGGDELEMTSLEMEVPDEDRRIAQEHL